MEDTIRNKFDDVLGRNMERLVGTRYGIGRLPASVNALSCIILLNEQVRSEIGEKALALKGYTRETLFDELEEMGLDTGNGMNATIHDMVSKDYIEFDEDNSILVKKPIVIMAQLLDHIYPKMPGLTLVAYISQTLDEAWSGRKDPDVATDQLDQVLRMHGVSLNRKQSPPDKGGTTRPDHLRRGAKHTVSRISAERHDRGGKIIRASAVLVEKNAVVSSNRPNASPVSSGAMISDKKPQEVEGGSRGDACSSHTSKVPDMEKNVESAHIAKLDEKVDKEESIVHQSEESPDKKSLRVSEQSYGIDIHTDETGDSEDGAPDIRQAYIPSSPTAIPEYRNEGGGEMGWMAEESVDSDAGKEPVIASEDSLPGSADTSIESQIAAFEAILAMKCPLCKTGDVRVCETSTGRKYYVCSHKDCAFITWGKPYHSSCPDCGNNFLVEAVFKGKAVLKCPRATCFYWQTNPAEPLKDVRSSGDMISQEALPRLVTVAKKPRKKVVRRRVIRKKSS